MSAELQNAVQNFLVMVVTGILGALGAFLIALAKKGFDWIGAKITSVRCETSRKELTSALAVLQDVVCTTVTSLQQTLGDEIRQSIKSKDGTYTRQDLLDLKDKAFSSIVDQLSESTSEVLSRSYGNIESLIKDLIETQVRNLKSESSGSETKSLLG